MKKKRLALLVAMAALCYGSTAFADDACSEECPAGQVRVGFADGGNANCTCVPEGSGMQEVVGEGGAPEEGSS